MKKPTGQPREANDRTLQCIAIERKILKKMHSGFLGIPESDVEEGASDEEGGGDAGASVPRRMPSPSRVSKTRANEFIRTQLASSRVPTATVVDDREIIREW